MIICHRDAIIDAHESCIGHTRTPHGEAYSGLGFRVPVRALKLKPLLQCESITQLVIKQTKLHTSIQHLARKNFNDKCNVAGTRPVVTYGADDARHASSRAQNIAPPNHKAGIR